MIYSRDRNRGFYWFAPVKGPEEWGGMPPPVAFDRDVLGDKQAWKAAKAAAKDFYKAVNFQGPRIKLYGSDFLIDGYVTSGDGIYYHPAWNGSTDQSAADIIVDELVGWAQSSAQEAAAEGMVMTWNLDGIERDVIRPKVVMASYPDDEDVAERVSALFGVMRGLKEQLDAANSDVETEVIEEQYGQAKARFDAEIDRLIEERGLGEMLDEIRSRLSEHFTEDPEQAIGAA
jgi:hypothetical protein